MKERELEREVQTPPTFTSPHTCVSGHDCQMFQKVKPFSDVEYVTFGWLHQTVKLMLAV